MTRRRTSVPEEDRAFLATLPLSHRAGACLFVHAGIQPGVPLEDQDPTDLMWIRDTFLFDTRDHGVLVVHGHTPVAAVEHHGNRLAIDTGAGWDGPVSAVVIEGREAWLLTRGPRARGEALLIGGRDLALVLLVVLAWGSNFSAMKIALEELPPLLFVGLRFAILVPLIVLFPARPGWLPSWPSGPSSTPASSRFSSARWRPM
jgi:hypothetical protein